MSPSRKFTFWIIDISYSTINKAIIRIDTCNKYLNIIENNEINYYNK